MTARHSRLIISQTLLIKIAHSKITRLSLHMGKVKKARQQRRKPYDPIKDMGDAERKAELLRRRQEEEDRRKTLEDIRDRQGRKRTEGSASRRSLKKYLRSLSKNKSFRQRAEELGITLSEYKTQYWTTLSKGQQVLLDLAITRESRGKSLREQAMSRGESRTAKADDEKDVSSKTKNERLEGGELLGSLWATGA